MTDSQPGPDRQTLVAAVNDLAAEPFYAAGDDLDDMCPNCLTPWKCNGPHQPPVEEPAGYLVNRAEVIALLLRSEAVEALSHDS